MQQLSTAKDFIRQAAVLLRVFAIPTVVALFASLVLAIPEQTLEYYRVLLEDLSYAPSAEFLRNFSIAVLALLAMATSIGITARVLEIADKERSITRKADGSVSSWNAAYKWAPPIIAILPLLATAYGLLLAGKIGSEVHPADIVAEVRAFGDKDYAADLDLLLRWVVQAKVSFIYGSVFFVAAAAAFVACAHLLYDRTSAGSVLHRFTITRSALAASLGSIVGLILVFVWFPVRLPQFIGAIGIFALFVSCLVFTAGQLSIWSQETRIPVLSTMAILVLLFSWLDLNDNHDLRRIDRNGAPVELTSAAAAGATKLHEVEAEFLEWYRHRADAKAPRYANAKYPVYIVASQGGGLYAAAQTLMFLVKLQSSCERFASHLFAISGVSGGSVGAALYSAFAKDFPNAEVSCDMATAEVTDPAKMNAGRKAFFTSDPLLQKDYLSPLVAAALFPDFAQRFLPFRIPSWSRERALEQAFEQAWLDAAAQSLAPMSPSNAQSSSNPLRGGLVGSWNPAGARPALLLNTTETDSGRRRVISPFAFGATGSSDLRILPASPDYDVPLSAAAIASARFPWLTPAAWFWAPRGDANVKYRVVDGGYFDNSGVTTAIDLIQRLESVVKQHDLPVQIHLVVMTSKSSSEKSFYGLGEILAPIRSLLNTRSARVFTTLDSADRQLGTMTEQAKDGAASAARIRRLQKVEIDDFVTRLPLGWRLSLASNFQIDRRTGIIGHCVPNENFEQSSKIHAFGTADCVKLLMYHQLRGDNLDAALLAAGPQKK